MNLLLKNTILKFKCECTSDYKVQWKQIKLYILKDHQKWPCYGAFHKHCPNFKIQQSTIYNKGKDIIIVIFITHKFCTQYIEKLFDFSFIDDAV